MNKPFTTNPFVLLGAILTILVAVTYPNAGFCQSEDIFKEAINYTVKIRTAVELPFDRDDQGVSTGAGFIVDKDRGWIFTNAHVVSRSPSLTEVSFHNTEYAKAEKLYVDSYLDLAVLKMEPSQLPKTAINATLGCKSPPPTGHAVGAFGHPHKLSYTGTRGIISGRTTEYGPEFVQTDTPINPGNSGGPLVSMITGRVIGINTARVEEENSQNLNFAIPIEHTCKILELLKSDKDPSAPELPILFIKDSDRPGKLKVAVSYVTNSQLDLRVGDVIEEVVGYTREITNESTLMLALRGRLSDVSLKVRRNNETLIVKGKLKSAGLVTERKGLFVTGLLIASGRFYRDASEFNALKQLRIQHVNAGSLGASKEITAADIIQSVDGRPVLDLDELYNYLKTASQENRSVKLLIRRFDGRSNDEIFEYREHTLAFCLFSRLSVCLSCCSYLCLLSLI